MTDNVNKSRCYNCGKLRNLFVTIKSKTFCCKCAYYIQKAILQQGNEDWIYLDKKLEKDHTYENLKNN
jgi:hypothetical protein